MNEGVKSAMRVLDLLELLATAPERFGVSEVARRMGIPKSSAHMLLSTLERRRYVVCDAAKRYGLHPMLSAGGGSWIGGPRASLSRVAPAHMERLVKATGETTLLGVLRDARNLEYIAKVLSPQEMRCDCELHQPRPLHCLSMGWVLLAFQPEQRLEAFLRGGKLRRFTLQTTCEPASLRREIAAVRRQGYAVTRDAHSAGISGVAAPVFDGDGQVIAGISVFVPSSRFEEILERAIKVVPQVAAQLSAELSTRDRRAAA